MHLVTELVQPIVDKTMVIVQKNINIMNADAIIIASGDPDIIGIFHEGASEAINEKKSVRVYPDEVGLLRGVIRPGVNLPIIVGGKIVGVVGISGHPEEVIASAQLVKIMLESMLEQIILKEHLALETRANENFLNDLLAGKVEQDEHLFLNRAGILGYDITLPRYAIVVNIDNFREVVKKKTAQHKNILAEIDLQQLRENVLACLKATKLFSTDIIIFVGGDEFVCLHAGDLPLEKGRERHEVTTELLAMQNKIKAETGIDITVGIGTRYRSFKDYHRSFQEGRSAIKLGKCLGSAGRIFWIDELRLENLVASIPEKVLRSYVDNTFGPEILRKQPEARDEILRTLDAFFRSSLNPTKAAREIFVHRNTIIFRLNKLYKETGYNPANVFADAGELYIALLAYKLLKTGVFSQDAADGGE